MERAITNEAAHGITTWNGDGTRVRFALFVVDKTL